MLSVSTHYPASVRFDSAHITGCGFSAVPSTPWMLSAIVDVTQAYFHSLTKRRRILQSSDGVEEVHNVYDPTETINTRMRPIDNSTVHPSSTQTQADPPLEPVPSINSHAPDARYTINFLLNDGPPLLATAVNSKKRTRLSREAGDQVLYGPDDRGRWVVYRVADRATTGEHKGKYKVIWYGDSPRRNKPVTYEPRKHLYRQGLKQAVLLVDRWIRKGRVGTLRMFARTEQPRGALFTASRRGQGGTCGFDALRLACSLQGRDDVVTQSNVNAFIADVKTRRNVDLKLGTSWHDLNEFAQHLRTQKSALSYDGLRRNFLGQSANRVAVIKELALPNGFYIVAGFRPDDLGHCFVMQVTDGVFTVHEDGHETELSEYGHWIDELSFVRRVVLRN